MSLGHRKTLRGIWRLSQPLINSKVADLGRLPAYYFRYLRDWKRFQALGGEAPFEELAPNLFDRQNTQSGAGHYFYQDVWALNKLAELGPAEHHDIGSRFDGFVGQATAICPIICYDIRPPNFRLPRFEFRQGNILSLPLEDQSVRSLSCLHVGEHIGLGRYGDSLDPKGTWKALKELMRVLAQEGQLLLSLPIGRERVCFNAERIWHPNRAIEALQELTLVEFKAVDDRGEFQENISPQELVNAKYGCGLYCFRRGSKSEYKPSSS
jgi:SAM-dependent methyltransferase